MVTVVDSPIVLANEWVILDRTATDDSTAISYPFALDEMLGKQVGADGLAICHLWRHPRAFVIGSRDNRLPGAKQAMNGLEREGYATFVRSSGGAAVPLDLGVVNVSLIVPALGNRAGEHDLRADFERMYALLLKAIATFGYAANKGEVQGAYCPGEYDMHIGGRKFCGISQRRQVSATIVQAFVNVEGFGDARTELVRAFYDQAAKGAEPDAYPAVVAGRMTSLQEAGVVGADRAASFVVAVKQAARALPRLGTGAEAAFRMPEAGLIQRACEEISRRYS